MITKQYVLDYALCTDILIAKLQVLPYYTLKVKRFKIYLAS